MSVDQCLSPSSWEAEDEMDSGLCCSSIAWMLETKLMYGCVVFQKPCLLRKRLFSDGFGHTCVADFSSTGCDLSGRTRSQSSNVVAADFESEDKDL